MGLKGSGPYFQRSMQNKVLNGLVYEICEIYIDDILIHGKSEAEFLRNVRRVFERLRAKNVAVNPKKTKLGLPEDTATPILQTDASDYGIGGYLNMVTNSKVRVIRFFSKALTGAQLNWSIREIECYVIYFGCKTFEDLLDNRHFILKTDHMNLTYLNVTLTGTVQR